MVNKITRRLFLKISVLAALFMSRAKFSLSQTANQWNSKMNMSHGEKLTQNLGVDEDEISRVYIVRGQTPEDNVKNAVKLIGGIEKLVDKQDIVILKPNAQWWNHGTTNTNNMKRFIELVLEIPNFNGEIIVAENHHYDEANSRGWSTENRNGDYNLNELVKYFNDLGYQNVTKYHWIDGGPNPQPQEGDAGGGNIVSSVEEGDGYVWLKDSIYVSQENRKCMMTYPVFTSSFSGHKIDLKRGTSQNGKYINNVKLINFSCLNHHSYAFGPTASIKNLLGVVDLICGFHGSEPKSFYNMHFIGKQSLLYQMGNDLKYYGKKFGFGTGMGRELLKSGYWNCHFTGGALGYWMKTVRMPDLNILVAEYVGWGGRGRHGPDKRNKANCVAISTDPVALDYVGAKQILLAATPDNEKYYNELNNPDNPPFRQFLQECHSQGIGNLSPEKIKVIEVS